MTGQITALLTGVPTEAGYRSAPTESSGYHVIKQLWVPMPSSRVRRVAMLSGQWQQVPMFSVLALSVLQQATRAWWLLQSEQKHLILCYLDHGLAVATAAIPIYCQCSGDCLCHRSGTSSGAFDSPGGDSFVCMPALHAGVECRCLLGNACFAC
jgi:hypothetical protein